MKKNLFLFFSPLTAFFLFTLFFFNPFFIYKELPIPSDTIIGLYHPFRDFYAKDYPNGIPFKNFLITDPVRQQYPWRELAIDIEKKIQLPLWNPYQMAGTPLLANFQSSVFYPFNIIFFILPFNFAWGVLVIFQILLAGVFTYLYLDWLKINKWASVLGSIAFSFSGFSIAWLEWNTILQTAIWLPLILLSIDKIFFMWQNGKLNNKKSLLWSASFLFALSSSFLAGHLQTFFYVFLVSNIHFFGTWFFQGKTKKSFTLFAALCLLFLILTVEQWIPTLQFISYSARSIDLVNWKTDGWFIPWQNLVQFIAPDFFGNPTTLNYWGIWNYGEFVGYIGIFPLIMALFAIFFRHDKKTFCFGTMFFLSLIFALPTFFAKLPFILNIPFISTSQPTRLLFLTDFSLAMLAALGFDHFLRQKKSIVYPLGFLGLLFICLWVFIMFGTTIKNIGPENLPVVKNNLILPTILFVAISFCILILKFFAKKNKIFTTAIYVIIFFITFFDLLRFSNKFTSFTKEEYLFPSTKAISFLQQNNGNFRIMTTDSRIFPPNFATKYRIQSIDGYDPLYLQRYGELIVASQRGKPDISPPFGFNRIITPHNYDSKIIDLLGVKYVLSLSDISSPKLKKVFWEGETRIYENKEVLPRAFFVENTYVSYSKEETIKKIFKINLGRNAIIESGKEGKQSIGKAKITHYSENEVYIATENTEDGFLVLTDSFYPIWHAKIDWVETKIYRTDYNFRGIFVPKGKHVIKFYVSLL